jgi:hypothetical protein
MIIMKKSIVILSLFFFLICLVGCNSIQKKSPGPIIIPSPVYSSTPIIMASLIPSFTQTLAPTLSPTRNFSFETLESFRETDWAPIYGVFDKRGVKCDVGYKLEIPDVVVQMSDETWSIFTCSPQSEDSDAYWTPGAVDLGSRYTKLIKTDFSQSWTISYNDFRWSNKPDVYLSVYRWTQDGHYVYLEPGLPGGSGFYAPGYFWNSNHLYRLNLISGKFETILSDSENGFAFSLSPDGQYLAYANALEKKVVHIRNMSSGEEQQFLLDGDYVLTGTFVWKLDNTKLFFASALNGWEDGKAGISIFMLTLKNMHIQTVLFDDMRLLVPNRDYVWSNREVLKYLWPGENLLSVVSLYDGSLEYHSELALDIQTGNIIVLAIPRPGLVKSATPKP